MGAGESPPGSAGGSEAVEGSDMEESEEARTATPAQGPGAPAKAEHDRRVLTHMPRMVPIVYHGARARLTAPTHEGGRA